LWDVWKNSLSSNFLFIQKEFRPLDQYWREAIYSHVIFGYNNILALENIENFVHGDIQWDENVLTFELGPILLWIGFAHGDMIPWHLNLHSWIWNQINILLCTSKHYRYLFLFYTTTCPYGYFFLFQLLYCKKIQISKKIVHQVEKFIQEKNRKHYLCMLLGWA
jgi:hypothetical protein